MLRSVSFLESGVKKGRLNRVARIVRVALDIPVREPVRISAYSNWW